MNQDQRKFLLARVEQTYREEREKLDHQKPKEPSLNNYLVAAILDNTIELKSLESIREAIKKKVLALGVKETLTDTERRSWRNSDDDDRETHVISFSADVIFVYPEAYIKAYSEWKVKVKQVNEKIEMLHAQKETLLLKIQIGSNTSLDRLVDSVDNMIDITLMNSKLMLTDGKEEKK
jgi:hypothetical protein